MMPLTASSHLPFTKMHGLGNDFMVLDATRAPIQLSKEQIRQMADRHFGVGFDQLLMVEAPPTPEVDFGYRIFNADGSEVEQCGDRKSTRLNSSHVRISYAVFCLKKKKKIEE